MLTIVKSMSPEALEQTFQADDDDDATDDFKNPESDYYKMAFQSNPEELLNRIVADKNFGANFVLPEKKSMFGNCLCFVEIRALDSLLVFTGSGGSVESARADCCRNAIEYFRVVRGA